ncbi:PREDICTED: cyclic nucleotide-binding domain-containing protein 2 [Tinamus guttatus]|uniref:cyclic nucleotide-binding domain-containing protein 2 n=1 Tax=Tinamus guttatus TaxID=94827 RepID=UPI00052EF9A7|nr:PREDICTED: cyclic nucleotide-binding domain-containing protein 2 [Tinamus guttatus]
MEEKESATFPPDQERWLSSGHKISSRPIQHATTKFYKLARDIKIMKKICKILWEDLQEQKRLETDDMTSNKKCSKPSFNINKFRASKDNLPLRVIQITRKRPEWRTEEEVKFVQSCLQEIESYGSYSLRLQFLLAKVVRFEWFERGRVILKKGQCGISFYFIYFGSVALTDDEDGRSTLTALYPVVLQKGAKFGEVSVLKGTRRVATVVCLEDTKLFVVDKDDFFANQLNEELQEELCYRYNFIKGPVKFCVWLILLLARPITNGSVDSSHTFPRSLVSPGKLTRTILTPCGKLPADLALTVYMRVAVIHEGEIVGISQHFFPDHMQDRRNMVLVSKDAEVIWLRKDTFEKLLDLGKVLELHKRYPR